MAVLLADQKVTGSVHPERFSSHHGSLSRELRRSAEAAMHQSEDAVTLCTSTLELGVDLPDVHLVGQIDTCLSVAGLRQRLGRSGREEGGSPRLRCYITAPKPGAALSALHPPLVQTIASLRLILRENWVEPVDTADLGLSTLVHQVLARLADGSGAHAEALWDLLCRRGPWRRVSAEMFAVLLKGLGATGLLRQDGDGRLQLDDGGLALVGKRGFLAVFEGVAEYTIRHGSKTLGTLPVTYPLAPGRTLAFGGRLWQVEDIGGSGWVVYVVPHGAGLTAQFPPSLGHVHERVRQEMREVYVDPTPADYLDQRAAGHLAVAQETFAESGLANRSFIEDRHGSSAFLWTGTRQLATVQAWLRLRYAVSATIDDLALHLPIDAASGRRMLEELLGDGDPTPRALAEGIPEQQMRAVGKFDRYLPLHLLLDEHGSRTYDIPGARRAIEELCLPTTAHADDRERSEPVGLTVVASNIGAEARASV